MRRNRTDQHLSRAVLQDKARLPNLRGVYFEEGRASSVEIPSVLHITAHHAG